MGITATEIHIAVIADVDNPICPTCSRARRTRSRASAKYLNSKAGGGGLAGRKVVVDFYDSKLNPTRRTNAEIQACQNDVAMVGTSAVFLTSVDDMRNCKDSTGAVTGLPDIPFVTTALVAAVLGPVVPDGAAAGDLLHRDPAPADLPAERRPRRTTTRRSTARTSTASTSSAATRSRPVTRRSSSGIGQMRGRGHASPTRTSTSRAARRSRRYTPVVQAMKNDGSNYGQAHARAPQHDPPPQGGDAAGPHRREGVGLRRAVLQTRSSSSDGGSDVEGEYVDTLFLPVPEQGGAEGQPDARELREVHGCRQGGRLRCLRLVGGDRLP